MEKIEMMSGEGVLKSPDGEGGGVLKSPDGVGF